MDTVKMLDNEWANKVAAQHNTNNNVVLTVLAGHAWELVYTIYPTNPTMRYHTWGYLTNVVRSFENDDKKIAFWRSEIDSMRYAINEYEKNYR